MLYRELQTRVGQYVNAVNAATPARDKANREGLLWLVQEGRRLVLVDVTDTVVQATDPIIRRLGACIRRLQTMRGGEYAPCVI